MMLEDMFAHIEESKFPIKSVIFFGIIIGISIGSFAVG